MKLGLLHGAFSSLPGFRAAGDDIQFYMRCPFCGDSRSDPNATSFSIRLGVGDEEPILYTCFRASCGAKGTLKTDDLVTFGITDRDVLVELSNHNQTVRKNFDKKIMNKSVRDYTLVNLNTQFNTSKLSYINRRLGLDLTTKDLADLKIQLSIKDLLRINDIQKISVKPRYIDMLDSYTIGFISMYNEYMVCRDITKENKLGKRYYMYRISGVADPDDMRVYSIPQSINLLDPAPATINVAEGPFSILGAYFNSGYVSSTTNNVWMANCGAQYKRAIMHVCRQYGLLSVNLNIWSDSEVKPNVYRSLYKELKGSLDIQSFTVYYNELAEDFGYPKAAISLSGMSIV